MPLSLKRSMKFASTRIAATLFLLIASAPGPPACAGGPAPRADRQPGREVRAVWLTTAAGLDWPSTFDTSEQKASLRAIIDRLGRAGFNTVFFQVRGRGDACYRSRIEPWSEVFTGEPGADPGWDPLEFAIAETHRRGMELHAWFNTYFVKGGTAAAGRTSPPHVMVSHPGWVKFHEDRWWLDPGAPGVDEYLAGVVRDIASRYDVDGIHLDYMRYPGRDFDDAATYARYGGGVPKDEWRRGNVTRFLTRVRRMLLDVKPLLKLGAAPIGIYRNPRGVRGLESYSDVYQDTYRWMELGLLDYVVPQLYWTIGGGNGDPDFAGMAAEWRERTAGCQLYLGIGSYKAEVLAQSDRLVSVARAAGAEGEAFFRYASIAGALPLASYGAPALPPAMAWKDSVPPPPPAAAADTGDGAFRRITWLPPAGSDEPGGRYAVYRMTGEEDGSTTAERLLAVVPASVTAVTDTAPAGGFGVWYAVTSIDRSWNESPPVKASRTGTALAGPVQPAGSAPAPARLPAGILIVGTPWADPLSGVMFVPFRLTGGALVTVEIRSDQGGSAVRSRQAAGRPGGQVIGLDIRGVPGGKYVCTVTAGADAIGRPVKLGR
jgi:uncharacterized lipoprotein YddW (UPF0748 family)